MLKLTGGNRLGVHMTVWLCMVLAPPTVKNAPWLGFSKHEGGSYDGMLVDANATGLIFVKGTHSKREVLGHHIANNELSRQRAWAAAAHILCSTFLDFLKRSLTIVMTVALAL